MSVMSIYKIYLGLFCSSLYTCSQLSLWVLVSPKRVNRALTSIVLKTSDSNIFLVDSVSRNFFSRWYGWIFISWEIFLCKLVKLFQILELYLKRSKHSSHVLCGTLLWAPFIIFGLASIDWYVIASHTSFMWFNFSTATAWRKCFIAPLVNDLRRC